MLAIAEKLPLVWVAVVQGICYISIRKFLVFAGKEWVLARSFVCPNRSASITWRHLR